MRPFEEFFQERHISLAVARAWRQRHGLPVVRIGRRLYVIPADFETWIERHKSAAAPTPTKAPRLEGRETSTRLSAKMIKIY